MDTDASPLGGTEVHYLDSEHVGAEFKIFVGHCGTEGVDAPAVLYLTDANGQFGGTVDAIRLMQLSRHLPPLLVVGIGYRVPTIADTIHQRTRDLTPTAWPAYARFEPERTEWAELPTSSRSSATSSCPGWWPVQQFARRDVLRSFARRPVRDVRVARARRTRSRAT